MTPSPRFLCRMAINMAWLPDYMSTCQKAPMSELVTTVKQLRQKWQGTTGGNCGAVSSSETMDTGTGQVIKVITTNVGASGWLCKADL